MSKPKDLISKAVKEFRAPPPPKPPTAQDLIVGPLQPKEPSAAQLEGARVLWALQLGREQEAADRAAAKERADRARDEAILAAVRARQIG